MGVAVDGAEEAEKRVSLGYGALRGRALVREKLVRHLAALPRPKRVSAEQHERDLESLVVKLAYMSGPALDGVCELALRMAAGARCPDVSLIRHWAITIEPPPPQVSDYAGSILRSALGRRAQAEGCLVELLHVARKFGPPPGQYVFSKLIDAARENGRRYAEAMDQAKHGELVGELKRWVDAYDADLALCEAIRRGAVLDDDTEEGKAA